MLNNSISKTVLIKLSRDSSFILTLVVVLLMIIIGFFEPKFLGMSNIISLFRATSVYMILVTGMTFVLISGGIDLSHGALIALGSIIASSLISDYNMPIFLAIPLAVILGGIFGLVNGFMISRFNLPPFMVTLAVGGIIKGLNLLISGGRVYYDYPSSLMWIGRGTVLKFIPVPVLIGILVMLIGHYLLDYTKFGRYVKAIGGNQEYASLAGINIFLYKTLVYVLLGALAAFAGILLMARSGSTQAAVGEQMILHTIASVIVGGTSLFGGRGTIYGSFLGAFLFSILSNIIILLGIGSLWHQVIVGIVIVLIVGVVTVKEGLNRKTRGESLI